jgi:hypothetical protein
MISSPRVRLQQLALRLRRSLGRHRRRWVIALVATLLAYPVLGSLALSSGFLEWLLRSDELTIVLSGPAYTLLPGRVHVGKLRLWSSTSAQLSLEADQVRLDLALHELLARRVHVTRMNASAVRYRMRLRDDSRTGRPARVAAFPPLEGLPPGSPRESSRADPKKGWTVWGEGLDVGVAELWFFEYRYLGGGRLRGAFEVGPGKMRVDRARQDFVKGELRFGAERRLVGQLEGSVSVDIAELDPTTHADKSFFRALSGRVEARSNLESLANLNAYFDELDVTGGKGSLETTLVIDRGAFGPESRLQYRTDEVTVRYGQLAVRTDVAATFDGAGAEGSLPTSRLASRRSHLSFTRGERAFELTSQGQELNVVLDSLRLTGESRFERAELRLPQIASEDLVDLGAVLPPSWPLEMHGGKAVSSVSLSVDREFSVRGPVQTVFTGYGVTVAGVSVGGELRASATLELHPGAEVYKIKDAKLRLSDTRVRTARERSDGWWLDASTEEVELRRGDPPRLETTLSLRSRDLEPVLEALAAKDAISGLIPALVSLPEFRSKVTLRTRSPALDVVMESESQVWDASGRIFSDAETSRFALVVGGQAVSLGIAGKDGEVEVMPFAKSAWLNERLALFPKPLARFPKGKP